MKMDIRRFLFLLLLLLSPPVWAGEVPIHKPKDPVVTANQPASGFLDAAFSDKLWWEQQAERDNNRDVWVKLYQEKLGVSDFFKKDRAYIKTQTHYSFPWFEPYILQDKSKLQLESLHKWHGQITVGIGWPAVPAQPNKTRFSNANPDAMFPAYKNIEKYLKKTLPEFKERAGIDIELIKPGDQRENTAEFAKIRIIPDRFWWSAEMPPRERNYPYPYDMEKWLWASLAMPSPVGNAFDGYLLLKEDNSLGLAVCKISVDLPKEKFEKLISLCVVRSLGLTGRLNEKSSIRSVLKNYNEDITAYDFSMLRTLYCPKLASGMSREAVSEDLSDSNQCFTGDFKK